MINGIINVYKEKGFTSHDVVAKLRGIFKQKKIGHTGTLDPDAEGVLPVCLGRATKVCDLLTDKDKTYRAELLLGMATDTQDVSGTVLETKDVSVTEDEVKQAVLSFIGEYEQIPPMYSALKINGKRLYELARAGVTVERKARRVEIYSIQILRIELPVAEIEVHCSKGTYIRTLCHDIGRKLGCGGCMKSLLRTQVGMFELERSLKLQEIEALVRREQIEELILPVDTLFASYQKVLCKPEFDKLVHNGNALKLSQCVAQIKEKAEHIRVYDSEHEFIGIYEWREDKKSYMPVKIFWETK